MMKAGTYYIGDLCYVMSPEWEEFCELTINGHSVMDGEFNLKDGRRFATFTTKYGDGCYQDEQGRDYGVDAGLIGCIRVEDITESERDRVSDGNVITFEKDFHPYESEGMIVFGHIHIDTDPYNIEDESEY